MQKKSLKDLNKERPYIGKNFRINTFKDFSIET